MASGIRWSEAAWDDLDGAAEYISRDSPRYADSMVREILNAVGSLREFPGRGRMVPDFEDPRLRELIVHSYRVIYRLSGSTITILGIIHGARDLPALWKHENRSGDDG